MLLAALIPLIQNCFFARPQSLRRRLLSMPRLVSAIYNETGWAYDECRQAATHICDLADEATDDELHALIEDCKA
jgi:hypothetical protein